MFYPNQLQIFGQKVAVEVSHVPFEEKSPEGRDLGKDVLGYFDPMHNIIRVFHTERCPELGGNTLIHEIIEATNQFGDLKLNHTQISTLSNALFQAFHQGNLSYVVAA